MNAVKSIIFLILVSGFAAIYAPIFLLTGGERILPVGLIYLAIPFWLTGVSMILWCFWTFTFYGQGTPAPIDPPKKLVAIGLHRFVRNPIYLGVLLILSGHVFWFGRLNLVIYLLMAFLAFHLFVLFYEEPTLKKKFGKQYEEYFKKRLVGCHVYHRNNLGMNEERRDIQRQLRSDLEKTRTDFHKILVSLDKNEFQRQSLNAGWTNGEVLAHISFGMMLAVPLIPITRFWGRLPHGSSRWFAGLLNSLTGLFNWINALGARGPGKVFGFHRVKIVYDHAHFSILRQIKMIKDDEWSNGMYYPTRWDANFEEFMTLEKIIRYTITHFEFHAKQISR